MSRLRRASPHPLQATRKQKRLRSMRRHNLLFCPGTPRSLRLPLLLVCLHTLLPLSHQLRSHEREQAFFGWHEQHHDTTTGTAASGADVLLIKSTFGTIRIKMRPDLSPKAVMLVTELASRPTPCKACHIYRHEPVPDNWGANGFFGPPYALLQGSLADLAEQPAFEAHPPVKRGDVCLIPNCKEFFIATADHTEWGTSHTVWGQVADEASWAVINAYPLEPYTTRTDSGNITTRWLTQEAHTPFSLSLEQPLQELQLRPLKPTR